MKHVKAIGLPGAMGDAFSSHRPHADACARTGAEPGDEGGVVVTFNTDDPKEPHELGRVYVPTPAYMEDVNLGERGSRVHTRPPFEP